MELTRLTLLERAGHGGDDAWADLDRLYRPFILGWFRKQGLDHDADDLAQDVMAAMLREISNFEHNGRTGAFRAWLRTICFHRLLNHRRQAARGAAVGGSSFLEQLGNVPSPEETQAWERDHDRAVLARAFELLEGEFEPKTMDAFRQLALDGKPAAEVAAQFSMSLGALYVAKSRVLRRLREVIEGMVDPALLEST